MALISRLYNFVAGTPAVADQVDAEFDQLVATVNSIDAANLAPAVAAILGLNQAGATARGKSSIATEESRTNASYGLMTTPDRVQSVVMPADGLLLVGFLGLWKESVIGAARAALFLGSNQLKVLKYGGTVPVTQAAGLNAPDSANVYCTLFSGPGGLFTDPGGAALGGQSLVGTGQALAGLGPGGGAASHELDGTLRSAPTNAPTGGLCLMKLDAGTYDVSLQFKASSGSVTTKDRHLWVWTLGF